VTVLRYEGRRACYCPGLAPWSAFPGRSIPRARSVVIHSYRHPLRLALGYPAYEDIEARLADLP
jgi:hypothetical protein